MQLIEKPEVRGIKLEVGGDLVLEAPISNCVLITSCQYSVPDWCQTELGKFFYVPCNDV